MLIKYEKRKVLHKRLQMIIAEAESVKRELTIKEEKEVEEMIDEIVELSKEIRKIENYFRDLKDEINKKLKNY